MRKLASIQKIEDLQPIEGADRIEKAVINGWEVVVQKGLHTVGDSVVYFEIDSWVPHEIAPDLSRGKQPSTYEGVEGARLKTIKLRGQISQGFVIPIRELPQLASKMDLAVGDDVTDILGVLKWEKTVHAIRSGQVKGSFPSFIPKTDQHRVQNLIKNKSFFAGEWEATLKLDGSSMTLFICDMEEDPFGVCSRNLCLKDNEDNDSNLFIQMARKLEYKETLLAVKEAVGFNFAVQGELMGPGVQGNREKFDTIKFFVFDIYNIDEQRYLLPNERLQVFSLLNAQNKNYQHVPFVSSCIDFGGGDGDLTVDLFLDIADRQSINHHIAEGVVFKSLTDHNKSFKAISNKFLLKCEE